MLVLSGCSGQTACSDGEVLKTVKKLFDQQQFGQFIQAPPNIFLVQEKSATLTSMDKQGGKSLCSVLVQSDIMEMARFTGTSEADIAKMKEEAPRRGLLQLSHEPLAINAAAVHHKVWVEVWAIK